MSNLLLRVTTSPPHSVFSCNAAAFCLLPSCIYYICTDWLHLLHLYWLITSSALEVASITNYSHSPPATRSKQPWPGSCSRFNWVFVRQRVGGCFSPRCSSTQFVLQSVLTRGHPSDSCGQFGQFTTRQWSAHTHRAWPVLCTAKLRSDGSNFIQCIVSCHYQQHPGLRISGITKVGFYWPVANQKCFNSCHCAPQSTLT